MRKLILLALMTLGTLFAESVDSKIYNKIKTLKPLDIPNVKVVKIRKVDDIYICKLSIAEKGRSRNGSAVVTSDFKHVVIGTSYNPVNGESEGVIDMSAYNKDAAFTMGNGTKGGEFYMFTDPECPVCLQLDKQLKDEDLLDGIKLHVFLYPLERIHPTSKKKCEYVLSHKESEREKIFDGILNNKDKKWESFAGITDDARANLIISKSLVKELNVGGTPTILDKAGNDVDLRVFISYLKALKKQNISKKGKIQ